MENVRQVAISDLSRIAGMVIFNYRLNFYPAYERHGFQITTDKKLEEDTTEYLICLER